MFSRQKTISHGKQLLRRAADGKPVFAGIGRGGPNDIGAGW
jgi:hypothetical protein